MSAGGSPHGADLSQLAHRGTPSVAPRLGSWSLEILDGGELDVVGIDAQRRRIGRVVPFDEHLRRQHPAVGRALLDSGRHVHVVAERGDGLADPPTVMVVADDGGSVGTDIDIVASADRQPTRFEPVLPSGGDPLPMMSTSGTTGLPKGLRVPVRALVAFDASMRFGLDVRPDDVYWNIADPGWAYGPAERSRRRVSGSARSSPDPDIFERSRRRAARDSMSVMRPVHFLGPLGAAVVLGASLSGGAILAQTDADEAVAPGDGVEPPAGAPIEVSVSLTLVNVPKIDELAATVQIDALLEASWEDREQVQPPCDTGATVLYEGEVAAARLLTDVWWPNFKVLESVGPREASGRAVAIRCDGAVEYSERFIATVSQRNFDFNAFPYDRHPLVVTLTTFAQRTDRVTFRGSDDGTGPNVRTWESDEWSVDHTSFKRPEVSNADDARPQAVFTAVLERKSSFYLLNVILPLVLIVLISCSVFWMQLSRMKLSDRVGVSVASFLTVVAFDFVTNRDLPQVPYTTRLDDLYLVSYVMITMTVVWSIVQDVRSGNSVAAEEPNQPGSEEVEPDGAEPAAGESWSGEPQQRPWWRSEWVAPVAFISLFSLGAVSAMRGYFPNAQRGRDEILVADGRRAATATETRATLADDRSASAEQIDEAGRARIYRVDLTEGDVYQLVVTPESGFDPVVTVTAPDGEVTRRDFGADGETESLQSAAEITGTYEVSVAGYGGSTGDFDVSIEFAGRLEIDEPVAGEIDETSGASTYQVELEAGDAYQVEVTPAPELDAILTITDPDGETIEQDEPGAGVSEAVTVVAATTGTYVVSVDGFPGSTGGFDLSVQRPNRLSIGDSVDGTDGEIVEAGEAHTYELELEAGDAYEVVVRPDPEFDPVLTVTAPGSEPVVVDDGAGGEAEVLAAAAPSTGIYAVAVTGFEGSTGDFELTFEIADLLEFDAPVSGAIDEAGGAGTYRLELDAGEAYRVVVRSERELVPILAIIDPDGGTRRDASADDDAAAITAVAATSGTHVVSVRAFEDAVGTYELEARSVDPEALELDDGSTAGAIDETGGAGTYELEVEAGTAYHVVVVPEPGFDPVLTVIDPDSGSIRRDTYGSGRTEVVATAAATTGTRVVSVTGSQGSIGSFDVSSDLAEELSIGDSASGRLDDARVARTYRCELEAGDTFEVVVVPESGFDPVLTVIQPDGQTSRQDEPGGGITETFVATAATAGTHVVSVTGFEGSTGGFQLDLRRRADG